MKNKNKKEDIISILQNGTRLHGGKHGREKNKVLNSLPILATPKWATIFCGTIPMPS